MEEGGTMTPHPQSPRYQQKFELNVTAPENPAPPSQASGNLNSPTLMFYQLSFLVRRNSITSPSYSLQLRGQWDPRRLGRSWGSPMLPYQPSHLPAGVFPIFPPASSFCFFCPLQISANTHLKLGGLGFQAHFWLMGLSPTTGHR